MSTIVYTAYSLPQTGNVSGLVLPANADAKGCTTHQLQIVCSDTPTAGTVTASYQSKNGDRYFPVRDTENAIVSMPVATEDLISIDGVELGSLKITVAGLAGVTSWFAILRGW